jgi:hypothetical protein
VDERRKIEAKSEMRLCNASGVGLDSYDKCLFAIISGINKENASV